MQHPAPTPNTSLCVFCGSGTGTNPTFAATAEALGRFIASHNIHLIYGGGDSGLMGALAQASAGAGGQVTGIIPEFLLKYQQQELNLTEQIITKSMHERKAKMYEMAGAFLALPGGIGTLEELVETMTWEQLGQHKKPIILLNTEKFWDPFLELLTHMKNNHFIRPGLDVNFHVIEDIAALKPLLHVSDDMSDEQSSTITSA